MWDCARQKQSFGDVLQTRCFKRFSNIHKKTLCWSLLFITLQAFRPATLLKKRLQHRCFPVNIAKFLRTASSIEHL